MWIDGKPIYRKVIISPRNYSTSATWFNLIQNDFNCKLITGVPYYIDLTETTNRECRLKVASSYIEMRIMDAPIHIGDYVILEYTKTTD